MIGILLLSVGVFFALLFILITVVRAVQGREKVSFFETLLAFLAVTLPLLALVNNNAIAQPLALINRAPIGIAAAVIVIGLIVLLIELRQPGRKFNQRRGVLGIGIGVLLVATTLVVPLASQLTSLPPIMGTQVFGSAPTDSDGLINIVESARESTQPAPLMPTNTPGVIALEVSPTPTHIPSATPTPTNTPYALISPTTSAITNESQPATAVRLSTCIALVENNLNLRSGAGMDNDLLLTIPSSTTLNVNARNEASTWWLVQYDAETGWVNGDYLTLGPGCADLPVRAG